MEIQLFHCNEHFGAVLIKRMIKTAKMKNSFESICQIFLEKLCIVTVQQEKEISANLTYS